MTGLKKGIIFLEVSEPLDFRYIAVNKITAKMFKTSYSRYILFEDLSGLQFSYTIEKPFSIKNIMKFLNSKFKEVKII